MTNTVSILLLAYILMCLAALSLVHVWSCRRHVACRRQVSPQAALARLILRGNVLMFVGAWGITLIEGRPPFEAASMLVFSGIVFNGIAYAYFHVFNMSETARRVRILLLVLTHDNMNADLLRESCLPRDMVSVRLDRLEQIGQIVRGSDERFRINRHLLLFMVRLLQVWRKILRFERNLAV